MDNLKAENIPFSNDWLKKYSPPFIFGTAVDECKGKDTRILEELWCINDIPRTQDDEDNLSFRVKMAKKFSFIPIIWDINDNIELDKQFIKPNTMKQELTEGQKRVRTSFNPSALKRVEEFKTMMAQAIDHLNEIATEVLETPNEIGDDTGDFMREVATAKTQLQIASMCGVAALTHDLAFKRLNNALFINSYTPQTNTVSNLPPHQQRVFDERAALATKVTALGEFINNNPIYKELPHEEQRDLSLQANIMQNYLDVLNSRIARF